MTPEQIHLVQATFAEIAPLGEVVGDIFYGHLFALDPSLRSLFHSDMRVQGRKLMTMLQVVVHSLDRPNALLPAARALGKRHANYAVTAEHYATVGAALLWTLRQGLGGDFTPETEAAWTAAYTMLADVMQATAAEHDPAPHPLAAVGMPLAASLA
jgi:hemoglobin-like flavoprotein